VVRLNRRTWMQSVAAGAVSLSAASYLRAAGANERVRVAVIGTGSRGQSHINGWQETPNAELACACDIDANRLAGALKTNSALQGISDLRRVLDDMSIDAISIATPDHWHAPAALLALEAGKHVYVEKPCAHNLREARALVDAARRTKLCVQHGTQSRSNPFVVAAIQLLREGIIGDVVMAKAWNVQKRSNIGHAQPSTPPPGIDYDTWLGPAPEVPFQANRFHYNWHWWYDFGTGDFGNDGVHDTDIARWGLGVTGLPSQVAAIGGKYVYDDDQQFPDTLTAAFEYPGDGAVGNRRQLVFEMRIWTRNSPFNSDNACEFYGTKGNMVLSKGGSGAGKLQVTDHEKRRIPNEKLPQPASYAAVLVNHLSNFVAGIREGQPLNAEIEIGYESTALCHLGNAAVRLGRSMMPFDPVKVQISGDDAANQLLGREYRSSHWSVPKGLV
jgi:predicted dehydrogenase